MGFCQRSIELRLVGLFGHEKRCWAVSRVGYVPFNAINYLFFSHVCIDKLVGWFIVLRLPNKARELCLFLVNNSPDQLPVKFVIVISMDIIYVDILTGEILSSVKVASLVHINWTVFFSYRLGKNGGGYH